MKSIKDITVGDTIYSKGTFYFVESENEMLSITDIGLGLPYPTLSTLDVLECKGHEDWEIIGNYKWQR